MFASFLSQIFRRMRNWRNEQRAMRELEALSDRELNDLGISRYDIPTLVRGAAA